MRKNTVTKKLLLIIITLLFIFPAEGLALRETPRTSSDMARSSNDIVFAECISSETKLDENYNLVFTYITFRVNSNVKQDVGLEENIVLKLLGGELGDMRVYVPGMPNFRVGNEYILFLGNRDQEGYYSLESLINGVLNIRVDEATGRKIVLGALQGDINQGEKTGKTLNNEKLYVEDLMDNFKKILEEDVGG